MENLFLVKDITGQLEIVPKESSDMIGIIRQNDSEYFGNYHTSFFPERLDGSFFVFNGWVLEEFYVNKQWNESFLMRLMVHKDGMPLLNLRDSLRLIAKGYYNRRYSSTIEMYSYILRDCIKFLESIPEDIITENGVWLWKKIEGVGNKRQLIPFYKKFHEKRFGLTEREVNLIEEMFINKLERILDDGK